MQWHLGWDAIEKKQRSGQIIIKKAPDAEWNRMNGRTGWNGMKGKATSELKTTRKWSEAVNKSRNAAKKLTW